MRYGVAMSLDGFIAGPNEEIDWIVMDSQIDFRAMYSEYDAVVMGRKTWDLAKQMGQSGAMPGMDVIVFSRTARAESTPGFRVTSDDPRAVVKAMKKQPGKDIWLFGGGRLFHELLSAGLVDTVEVAVMPVLLGDGIPVLPPGASTKLKLVDHKVLPRSGIVMLAYSVPGGVAPASEIKHVRPARQRSARAKRARSRAQKR